MIVMESSWEKHEIVEREPLRRTSSVYYDDIDNPSSPRDTKNLKVQDRTSIKETPDAS